MPEGEIFDAIERFRRELLSNERRAASELVRVYGEAWKRIKAELECLHTEYEATKARGEKPGPGWIYQFNRARAFRDQVERELLAFAQYAENQVREQQRDAIEAAERRAEELTRRALGNPPPGLTIDWNRIDRYAVETLLGMTQADSPLHRLLLSISGNGAQAAEDALVQGMLLGKNPRQVAREMRRALGVTLSRALTIARTETLRAHREATRASYQANNDIVTGWIWHSATDERTCAACWAMHGTEHKVDEILDDHPNGRCLTPGTVVSGPLATALVTRYYEGDVITISTSFGKFLTVTPNHPVLTNRGWVAANLLKKGDYVVSGGGGNWTSSGVCPDDYQMPTVIEDIQRSLNMTRFFTMPTAPEDFHGDGVGSDVHVIYSNRFLRSYLQPSFNKPFHEHDFCLRAPEGFLFSGDSTPDFFFFRDNSSSDTILGDFYSSQMFFCRGSLCKQAVGAYLVSDFDMIGNQSCSDCTSRYPKRFGKSVFRFAACVSPDNFFVGKTEVDSSGFSRLLSDNFVTEDFVTEQPMSLEIISEALFRSVAYGSSVLRAVARNVKFDRVTEVSITRFTGHVYNLQTMSGWYIANGIITHNCAMIPKTRTWAEIGKQYGIDLSDVPDTNPEIEPGVSLFERLPAEKQIKILGPAKYAAWKEGKFALSDVVGRARSKEWGTHRFEKSLVQLVGEKKAKGYTRLALMGVARNAGQYSADDLIRVAGLGLRELTPEELKRIVQHVAKAGFDPNGLEKCGGRLVGLVWNGKTLKGSDRLPPGEVHYLRHVVYGQEWPANTTLNEYYQSLREVIEDENSGIVVHKIGSEWQVGFLNTSSEWRGLAGNDIIFVDYRLSISYWVTGYQPDDFESLLASSKWSNIKWLRPFKIR